jgi:hypothetical protein
MYSVQSFVGSAVGVLLVCGAFFGEPGVQDGAVAI